MIGDPPTLKSCFDTKGAVVLYMKTTSFLKRLLSVC